MIFVTVVGRPFNGFRFSGTHDGDDDGDGVADGGGTGNSKTARQRTIQSARREGDEREARV